MEIRVDVVPRGHGKTSAAELRLIEHWGRELFAPEKALIDAFSWEDKRDLGFDLQTYCDETLAGHAHVFVRVARADCSPVLIGALGSVKTAAAFQGVGVGGATVRKAGELILGNLRADLGVLLCNPRLVPFYHRLGWEVLTGQVTVEQPGATMTWPHRAMALVSAGRALPTSLELLGPPF